MRSSSVLLFNASALAIGLVGITPASAQVQGPPEVVVPAQPEEDARDCDPAAQGAEGCENPDNNTTRNADGSEARGGTITVTGSRIRLPNLESFEPTTTVDRRQIQERNFTNVADAINELPGPRGSVTPAGAQGSFGQGVNFVNQYGLGSNRTLTLVNGRRFVTSNVASNFGNASAGTQTDLNVIPAIILDRIDLVGVGGAPVYGSDAIAGVLNVILRTRFDGIEAYALSGITEEGDNFRWNGSVLAGWDFGERANLTVAISHDEVRGLVYNDRDFLRENIGGVTNPSSAQAGLSRFPGVGPNNDLRLNPNIGFNNSTLDLAPGVVQARGVGIPFLTAGGLITETNLSRLTPLSGLTCNRSVANDPSSCVGIPTNNALHFDINGNLVPFNQGILFGANTQASGQSGDTFLFNNYSQITSDLNRTIFNGFFTFNVTDNIELFLEGTYFRSRADELVQQPTFNSNLFGGASGQLVFRTDNPFLTDQARAELTRRGVTQFQVSRVSSDLADLTGFNRTEIYRGVAGVRGDMNVLGRDWNWELSFNHGEAESRDYRQDLNAQNFANAVNVTRNASGAIVCTTAPTRLVTLANGTQVMTGFAAPGFSPDPDPNCVPFNPLGEGRASQAARDYIVEDTLTISRQRQQILNANLGGTLFDLPGGALGFNVGYEHRRETAKFTPDQFTVEGRGRSVAITPLQGGYTLNEVFGEVLLPLISPEMGIPFIQDARVFARGRYVDSSINGGFFAWAVGGSLAPVRDVEFRGNFTRSFRHPAITELFLPIVPAFSTVPDICSAATRSGGAAPAIRAANCAAFLARYPNVTPDPAASATVPILTGGNPNLDNEQADSWTAGVIVRPRFIPRFSATADYISITLDQPIASLTVAQVLSACFDNPDFDTADPANGNAFCSRVRRNTTTGQVINDPANPAVQVGFVNGVQIRFRGIQGTMNYSIPLDFWGMNGTFSIGADMLYVKSRLNNITGVAPARTDGILGDPEFSGQLRLRYAEDTWGTNWTVNYIGEQLFSRLNRLPGVAGSGPDAREIDELDDYVMVNAGIWFDPAEDFRLTLSVNNLFNRQGQEYFGTLHPSSYSDLLGRRFAASARVRF
jgi:outer membrane receptor protein involved in Fe transport